MEVSFASDELDRLESDPAFSGGFPDAVVKMYRKRLQTIRGALDERDFYALRSLHYEKLRGQRQHQRSMRLNRQWRLVLEIEDDGGRKRVRIVAVEDYH
jgi:proteic killer suppression protein